MIWISLSTENITTLTLLRCNQKSNVGDRAYYVLLSDSGKSVSEIAPLMIFGELYFLRIKNEGILEHQNITQLSDFGIG